MNLKNLIEDLMAWNFRDYVVHFHHTKNKVELDKLALELMSQSVIYVMNWIYDFVMRPAEIPDPKYTKQVLCHEFNIVNMVLAVTRILLGMENQTTLMMFCSKVIITVCEENALTQSQLLMGNSE